MNIEYNLKNQKKEDGKKEFFVKVAIKQLLIEN
jgi:hypothetical protein